MNNPVFDAIQARRSCRSYKPEMPSEEMVDALVQSALAAPSAMNRQPWRVVVVQKQALLLELEQAVIDYFVKHGQTEVVERIASRGNKVFYNAPLAFFLAVEDGAMDDIGIAAENIALAAQGMGLGSVILGMPRYPMQDPDTMQYWKEKLGFPAGFEYGLCVAVGYVDDSGSPHPIDREKVSYIR